MMLGSHAGPLVRAEGREHLVTACDAPAVTPGSARVLIRLSSGEDVGGRHVRGSL